MKVITESVKRIINEDYNLLSDDDFASTGDPYGLTNQPIDYNLFKVKSISVDGEDVTQDFFNFAAQSFYDKYEFVQSLKQYFKEMFDTDIYDVDTAREFGEDGDEIYVNTKPKRNVEIHGGYDELSESVTRIDEGQGWDTLKDVWNRRNQWMYNDSEYNKFNTKRFNKELNNWENTGDKGIKRTAEWMGKRYYDTKYPQKRAYPTDGENDERELKPISNSLRAKTGRKAAGLAIRGLRQFGKFRNKMRGNNQERTHGKIM